MKKLHIYDLFIGFLALMISLMLLTDILLTIPLRVTLTFYYTEHIVKILFLGDILYYLIFNRNIKKKGSHFVLDLLSVIPLSSYMAIMKFLTPDYYFHDSTLFQIIRFLMVIIYFIKFKFRVTEEIKENRVYLLLIISTLIIIVGAVLISLVEGISLSDAIWWSFVTFTTVGYGDIVLKTQLGRGIAVILMFIGIGFIGVTTTALALYILEGPYKDKCHNNKVVDGLKDMLDNYNSLSDEDIDEISRVLKSLRNKDK